MSKDRGLNDRGIDSDLIWAYLMSAFLYQLQVCWSPETAALEGHKYHSKFPTP